MPGNNLRSRLAAAEKAVVAAGPRRGEAELAAALRFAWDHPGEGGEAVRLARRLKFGAEASERFERDLHLIYGKPGDGALDSGNPRR